MIPFRQSVYRSISRGSVYRLRNIPIILNRFQSTSESLSTVVTPTETANPKEPLQKPKHTKRSEERRINAKLKDIAHQIKETIDKSSEDLRDSFEILEEGIIYVREIQSAERISESDIFRSFAPLANELFLKALKPGSYLGSKRTIDDVFKFLVKQRIAQHGEFTAMAFLAIQKEDRLIAFDKILKLRVDLLEYSSVKQSLRMKVSEESAKIYDFTNLATYSFVLSCVEKGKTFTIDDILKLIQRKRIPNEYSIGETLKMLKVYEEEEFKRFKSSLHAQMAKEFNPNGPLVTSNLNEAIRAKDAKRIWQIYNDIQESCANHGKQVACITLEKVMYAFQQSDRPDDVFEIFQVMLNQGITPSSQAWSIILATIAKPSTVANQSKETSIQNFERIIATIQSSNVKITPRLLASIVAGFANFDCFDKVEEYLEKYSDLPLVSPGKDGILIGLVLNGKIGQANAKFDEYTKDGSGYIPSSITINVFLDYYVKEKNYKAADGVVEYMRKNNVVETHPITTTIIDAYCKRQFEKGLEPDTNVVIKMIQQSNKIEFNLYALVSMIDSFGSSNIQIARLIYSHGVQVKPKETSLHTAMIKAELSFGDLTKARQIFDYVINNNGTNENRMWNMMINGCLHHDANLSFEYFEQMKKHDVKPNAFTFYFLLNHAIKKNNTVLIRKIISEIAAAELPTLGTQLPKIIVELSNKHHIPPALLSQAQKEI
ncbi:hypothetical protein JA1_001119 [Spathaspora sp. JA1]|nr:hypothetical protein JA1_001119 [Spathaspora sp. JA1]